MTGFIIRRVLQAIPVLIAISLLTFTLSRLVPNSPFDVELALTPGIEQSDIDRLKAKHGLDKPIHEQYLIWIGKALRFDFGTSFFTKRPVQDMIAERIGPTMLLFGLGLLVSIGIGAPLGVITALKRNSRFDHILRGTVVVLTSLPTFTVGLLTLLIVGGIFRLIPMSGMFTPGKAGDPLDLAHHLIAPVLVLGAEGCVGYIRLLRTQTLDVLNQDFMRTATAKGLTRGQAIRRHLVPNTLIPLWTGVGSLLPGIIAGGALVERIFSWPGLGQLTLDSAFRRDYHVILTIILLLSVLLVVGFIIRDIGYRWVDPRISAP